ncbi:hypothetical protein FHW03_004643 [Ochrobactrum sp. RH2CCR150]|nr:hypothetical protein [Ochrobactrum sp. RH2CCR150]
MEYFKRSNKTYVAVGLSDTIGGKSDDLGQIKFGTDYPDLYDFTNFGANRRTSCPMAVSFRAQC